jgi:hypothetical protein
LGAHIQFVTNGILFIVLAVLVLKLPHNLGHKSIWAMVLSVRLVWPMALSENSMRVQLFNYHSVQAFSMLHEIPSDTIIVASW